MAKTWQRIHISQVSFTLRSPFSVCSACTMLLVTTGYTCIWLYYQNVLYVYVRNLASLVDIYQYWYTLCKIILAIVFVCVRSIISDFYCHFIASRDNCRSPKKDFQVNKIKNDQLQRCTSVTSIFKTSWRKAHFWWYSGVKTILQREFSHQNKERKNSCWKHLNRLQEIRLQIGKIWRFSMAFTILSQNSVSNRYFLNQLCVYSCLVPTNMLT